MTITPNPFVRHVVFGASVTRLAATPTATGLRHHIPYVVVDGLDNAAKGGTAYAIDGRGMTTPPTKVAGQPAGLDLEAGFYDEIARGVLRPDDWAIFDWTLGTEPVEVARPAVERVAQRCRIDGYRLAWVLPRVAYGAMTDVQARWMADARAMIEQTVCTVPWYVIIDWPKLVETWTLISAGSLSDDQEAVGQPLLYDGRHLTGANGTYPGRGCERWSAAVAAAVGY